MTISKKEKEIPEESEKVEKETKQETTPETKQEQHDEEHVVAIRKQPEVRPLPPSKVEKSEGEKVVEKKVEKPKKEEKKKERKRRERSPLFFTIGLSKERDYVIENLSLLVSSGMSILVALEGVKKGVRTSRMKKVISYIEERIESGEPLWRALTATKLFSSHATSLIKLGEESGRLGENLRVVSIEQEKQRIFKSKLRSAMMYPIFVLSVTLVVGIGIAWFILPKLAVVFSQLRAELPLITQFLIDGGEFLDEHGLVVIPPAIAVLGIILYFVFSFPKTKGVGQFILFAIPVIRRLIKEIELARMGYVFGTLLQAGLPVVQALDSLADSTEFYRYRRLYRHFKESIADGNSFGKSMESFRRTHTLIPPPIQQLIIAGEQSGSLSDIFLKIGETYETKADLTTKNLSVILEPILLVIVWLGVVGVALAVILPIYNLIGGFNAGTSIESPPPVVVSQEVSTTTPIQVEENTTINLEEGIPSGPVPLLKILSTETGYLNVRSEPSISGTLIKRILPNETYEYISTEDGWYEIMISDEVSGWVSGRYIEVLDNL